MIDRLLLRKLLRTRLRLLHLNLLPESHSMSVPNSIHDYLRMFACELGERILQSFPALHNAHDPLSPRLPSCSSLHHCGMSGFAAAFHLTRNAGHFANPSPSPTRG
jgi:hypothetical protein